MSNDLKTFRVESILSRLNPLRFKLVAVEDPAGNYKAKSATDLEEVLNTSCQVRERDNILVKFRGKWHPIKR